MSELLKDVDARTKLAGNNKVDGYMLTRKIKSDKRFANIQVLMHSSLSSDSNQRLGKVVGVDEYVPKFEPQQLSQTLSRLLTKKNSTMAFTVTNN